MSKNKILSYSDLQARKQEIEINAAHKRAALLLEEANKFIEIRAALIKRLVSSSEVTMADIVDIDVCDGKLRLTVKDLKTLPRDVQRAIKKIKIRNSVDGQQVEVELAHHLEYDSLIGKYVGLFSDKTSDIANEIIKSVRGNVQGDHIPLSELSREELRAKREQLEKELKEIGGHD